MKDNYGFDDLLNRNSYSGDYLSNLNTDEKTKQSADTIQKLFDEWDEQDVPVNEETPISVDSLTYSANIDNTTSYEDPLEQTKQIDNVSLEQLKAWRDEIQKAIEEEQSESALDSELSQAQNENPLDNGASQAQGKALVKATKVGKAFSNGSMTQTFLDCVVLCFVTAAIGFGWLINIINQI